MRFDSDLLDSFQAIVAIEQPTAGGEDKYGGRTYDAPIRYRCFISTEPREMRGASGELLVVGAAITVAPVVVDSEGQLSELDQLPTISSESRVTLPDGTQPRCLSVEYNVGDPSIWHVVVYVGYYVNR